ncbi:phosphoribosyltransferase [Candidatus Micrarchaeota archaeon]|nr:phosphoribosyltransferase [Candidatus Micrarchaeota archaeon]
MEFLEPEWKDIIALSKKVCGDIKKDFEPDIIIGVSRGGLVPARLFSDYLDNSNVAIIRVELYTGVGTKNEKPVIIHPLQADIKGKKVLVVDDVSDSGESMAAVRDYLAEKNPGEIKFASLHYKPQSKFRPDYYAETTDKWIIYPWEIEETRREMEK